MTISLYWNSSWAALKLEWKKSLINSTVIETLQIIPQQHSKNFSEHLLCVRHCYYWPCTYCWMTQRHPRPQETLIKTSIILKYSLILLLIDLPDSAVGALTAVLRNTFQPGKTWEMPPTVSLSFGEMQKHIIIIQPLQSSTGKKPLQLLHRSKANWWQNPF